MWLRSLLFERILFAPEGAAAGEGGEGEGGAPPPDPALNGTGANAGGEEGPGEVDWRASITDPGLKTAAERFTTPEEAIKATVSLRRELSDRIKIPGPKATDEDLSKFRKAMGVPADEKGYEIEPPEGEDFDEQDQAVIEAFRPVAFKHNVPQSAFKEFIAELGEKALDIREQVAKRIETAQEEAEAALEKEWGTDYEKNLSMATRASKAHGGDRFINFLENVTVEGGGRLGDHPEMVRFLASIGRKSDEADMILKSNAEEVQSAQAELDALNNEVPPGTSAYTTPAHQKKLQELYARVAGDQPLVGTNQRTT